MKTHLADFGSRWVCRCVAINLLLGAALWLGARPASAAPVNDQCSGAIGLTNGIAYVMDNSTATSTGDPIPTCPYSFGHGVWFSFTPPTSGQVTVSLCGSSFDTVVAVYTGTCGALTQVACDDDNGPSCSTLQSSVQFTGTAGTTYYVLAGGYATYSGTLSVVATWPAPPSIRISPLTLTFSNAALASMAAPADQPATSAVAPAPSEKLTDAARILSSFTNGAMVPVIVNITPPKEVLAKTDFRSPSALKLLQAEIKNLQQQVLDSMPPGEVKPGFRYDNMAAFSAEVTLTGLEALQAHPQVVSIEPVFMVQQHLAQGIPLIHGMTYRSMYAGSNMAIAICDTGTDYTHARLGGGGFPNGKVIGGYDFGDNDSDPAPDPTEPHGTCCAGIAAGDLGTVGDYIGGVAYGARLYALKITSGSSGSASSAVMAASWDWCVTHRLDNPSYPIMVISTSFGGGQYFDSPSCDASYPSMTTAANNAVAAGITVLASSGNDGFCDSIAWPACISSVISVAAVYDAAFGTYLPCVNALSCAPKTASGGCATGYYATDQTAADMVTSYANMASFVTLLAPGNKCYTLDIVGSGGYSTGDYYDSFGGTSAACPYAAGAVACLQSAAKALTGNYLSPADVKTRLTTYGDLVTDTKVAITKPRVNLERAINSLVTGGQAFRIYNDGGGTLTVNSITPDTSAPWISLLPAPPLTISGSGYADVTVAVTYTNAPAGQTTSRLLVTSTDSTKSPYPGGVYIQVINGRPLSLSGMSWSSGTFRFDVNGPATSNCVVQASSNLVSWVPLLTNPIPGNGLFSVTNSGLPVNSRGFYRAQLP